MLNYSRELLIELISREDLNRYTGLMSIGQDFAAKFGVRADRAKAIDNLFRIASIKPLDMTDKSLIY